jgi:purine-cytosine permease-like protein
MVTVALSQGISWASYASDYSRYMRPTSSRAAIFWLTLGGLVLSYVWMGTIGVAAASLLGNQTAAGVRALMGGGALGVLALIAIAFGAITSNSMNDYAGSLAFQALGARVRRPVNAALVAMLAFAAILWIHAGDTSGKFQNMLLFIGYWLAPFCAIVMIDWHYGRHLYTPSFLRTRWSSATSAKAAPRSRPSWGVRCHDPVHEHLDRDRPGGEGAPGCRPGLLRRLCGRRSALLCAEKGSQPPRGGNSAALEPLRLGHKSRLSPAGWIQIRSTIRLVLFAALM